MIKKIIAGIVALVLVAAIGVCVYVFAIDKTIPADKVSEQIASIKTSKLVVDEKIPSMNYYLEDVSYTKDGDKTVTKYDTKGYLEFKNNSTEEAENYEIKSTTYKEDGSVDKVVKARYYMDGEKYMKDEDGTVTEISDFSELAFMVYVLDDFYGSDGALKADIVSMIDNNLEKVTQKGLNITLHLVKDTVKINIVYSLNAKKVVKIERTEDTYTDNVLTNREYQYVQF